MLESGARSAFIVACACNAAFAAMGAYTVDAPIISLNFAGLVGGSAAFIVATALGFGSLMDRGGLHHGWIKGALVFLALGPAVFWSLQSPAAGAAVCHDCSTNAAAYGRVLGDIMQSKLAMIAVALAALFCAAKAAMSTLEELSA